MTLPQRIRFYQQLAVLVRAGVPIRASLVRLKEKVRSTELALLSDKLNAGERIGDAFAAAGFSPFECHLVTAGEHSAHLDTIFEHLADFWSRELQMRQAMVRPLYYPIVVMHLAVLLGAGIQLLTLPATVVAVHLILTLAFLYTAAFVIYTLVTVSWSSPIMRRFWLFVPFVGKSLKTAYAYRWITALRLEFGAGVSLSRAVGDAWRASGYLDCQRLAQQGEEAMRAGTNLSTLVTQWKQLPRDWIDFIETGEISGGFEAAFKNLQEESSRAWTAAQARMNEWVPKIIYFVVLLIVAAQVASVMYKVEVQPLVDAEKQIDDATK